MKKLLSLAFILLYSIAFSQITITSTVSNVSCFGLSNGSATISVTGGTGPYTYTWLPTNTGSPNVLTNVSAGNYTVIVMDAMSNTNTQIINIYQPSQLNLIAGSNNACFGCNGAAYLSAFGGTPAYSYTWSNGSTMPRDLASLSPTTARMTCSRTSPRFRWTASAR